MAKAWLAAVLVGGLVASTPASAQSYSDLFVFGDSLVDSGNARAARLASGGADPAPPAQGYFEGRFSNGYNFADYLSISLGQGPATASLLGGTNFSVGGAQAAEVVGDASPSFAEQIGAFAASGAVFSADALVLVTLGGNDVRSELAKLGTIPGYTPTLAPALSAFTAGLSSLIDRGARNIVVTGLPDIGQIPAVTLLGSPQLSAAGSQLSFSLNQAFAQTVSSLSTKTTDLNLQFFNLFSYQAAIYADPTMYGLPPTLNTRTPPGSGGGTAVQWLRLLRYGSSDHADPRGDRGRPFASARDQCRSRTEHLGHDDLGLRIGWLWPAPPYLCDDGGTRRLSRLQDVSDSSARSLPLSTLRCY